MTSRALAALALLAIAAAADATPAPGVAEILERHAGARGGLSAWRKVQTMVWGGHVERADGPGAGMPFMFFQKRPQRSRFELVVDKARVGAGLRRRAGLEAEAGRGRPARRRSPTTRRSGAPPSTRRPSTARSSTPAARGVQVELEGQEEVEGRPAYRLRARLPSGATQRVWVDAETFLEVKYDRPVRPGAGRPGGVAIYPRDYKSFDGLLIPFTIETRPASGGAGDRLVIDRIAVGVPLADGMFARPGLRTARRGITVDTRSPSRGAVPP